MENYNEEAKRKAKQAGAVESRDRTPETGEGLHGERLSPLPNVSKDFPNPTNTKADLVGETSPKSPATLVALENNLPKVVTHAEIAAQSNERMNVGHPKR